jgi:hypothetical protein
MLQGLSRNPGAWDEHIYPYKEARSITPASAYVICSSFLAPLLRLILFPQPRGPALFSPHIKLSPCPSWYGIYSIVIFWPKRQLSLHRNASLASLLLVSAGDACCRWNTSRLNQIQAPGLRCQATSPDDSMDLRGRPESLDGISPAATAALPMAKLERDLEISTSLPPRRRQQPASG